MTVAQLDLIGGLKGHAAAQATSTGHREHLPNFKVFEIARG
jgi:hypothetical protein